MRPGRLLVVSYHFPPDGAVGGLRWSALGKYLAQRGWDVHVVTAASGPPGEDESATGVAVHRVPRRRTIDDAYNEWRSSATSAGSPASDGSDESGDGDGRPERRGPIRLLLRELGYLLAFPDYSRGWILRAARTVRRLRRIHEVDLVVTSGPPHGAHVAGALGAGRTPLVVDLRDPWLYQIQRYKDREILPSRLGRWLEPRLAGFTFRAARAAITNTESFAEELRQERPELPVALLQNGVDPDRLPDDSRAPEGRSIAHVGSLYAGRDLGAVMAALRRVLDRRVPEGGDDVRLRLAGVMDPIHAQKFRRQVQEAGLADRVDLLGLVPQEEALDVVRTSRLALVLAQDQPLQVPAKLYESVGVGVPTLVIAPPGSGSYREALRVGARACRPGDVEGIASVIEEVVLGEWSGPTRPADPIDYPALAARLEDILWEIMSSAGTRPRPLRRWTRSHEANQERIVVE